MQEKPIANPNSISGTCPHCDIYIQWSWKPFAEYNSYMGVVLIIVDILQSVVIVMKISFIIMEKYYILKIFC